MDGGIGTLPLSSSMFLMLCVKRLLFLLLNLVAGALPPCFPFPILSALWRLIEFSSVVSWSFSPHKWFIQIKWSYWAKVKLGFNLPQVSFEPSPCLLLFVEMFPSLKMVFFKILFERKEKRKKKLGILTVPGPGDVYCLRKLIAPWTSLLSLFRSDGWRECGKSMDEQLWQNPGSLIFSSTPASVLCSKGIKNSVSSILQVIVVLMLFPLAFQKGSCLLACPLNPEPASEDPRGTVWNLLKNEMQYHEE